MSVSLFSASASDFGALSTVLRFAKCQKKSCANVSIVDDVMLENVEVFGITLERSGLDSRITLEPVNGFVEIMDNDGV